MFIIRLNKHNCEKKLKVLNIKKDAVLCTLQRNSWSKPGAYLGGGIGPWPPPLGRQDCIISIEKYAKLWYGSPFVTWADSLSTETVGEDLFLAKNQTKFEWRPFFFFFGLHLILGRKTDLLLGWKIFILVFINLKFSGPPPPPFENPAYATSRS